MNGNSSGNGGRNEIQNLKNGLNKLIGVLQDSGDDIINDAKQSKSTSSHTTETTTTSSSSTGKTIHNKVETTYVTKVATQGTFNFDTSNAEKNIDKLETKVDNINTALDKLKTTLSKLSSIKSGGNFDISGLLKNLDSLSNTSNNSKVYGLIRNAVGNDKSDFNNNAVFGRLKGSLTKLKVDADTKVSEIIQYVDGINGFIEKLDSNIKKTDTQKIDINKTPKVDELTRGTKNVTVDDIIKTFGAVDVTISKAVKKAQKQQEALNKLYDNLLQLSTKTGIESSKIGQGLTFNLTKLNGGNGGQSTKKRISFDAINGWDDTTASHEIAHSLLSNLAKRLHGVSEFKRLGSMDAVNSLFDDKVFNRIKKNKGVSQTDINIAETIRNIVAKAIDKKQGNLFQKIDDNAKPDTDKDYYKRNSEIFARLFARGITGKAHESKFELDKTTFNKLIAPQLTKLVEQMYGPDAQKRIRITGSNSQTNNVINIARKNLQQKIEEREKNEGELHNSLSNARDSFASKVKSAVSESNSFEQNAKSVFNSSLKHFEESFKSAINNIAEIFKNQISNPIKEITVSFGTIVTALRQSGIITNNIKSNTTNSLKNTVKRVVNTEYEKNASDAVDDETEHTPKEYFGRKLRELIFPKSNNKTNNKTNQIKGQYATITTVNPKIKDNTSEVLIAAKESVGMQTNWFRHIRTARRMEQEAIDANMFGWIERGTTQKSYTEDLNKQFNDLNRLYEIYKRLGSNKGMSIIDKAIKSFKNEKMTIGNSDYSLFKNGKIDLTPSLVPDSNIKDKYYVEGIDSDFADKIKEKYQIIIDKAFKNIAKINKTRYANAEIKEGSDSTNDAILRMLRLNKLIDNLDSQLNEEKYKTSGLGLLQKYSTDDIGLISSIRKDYNRIQSGVLMGDYDTNAKQFQTDFALMKTDVDSVIKSIKHLFAVERELVNERQDNRENAFNAAKVAMSSKLDSARRFKEYGSGIDENTVLSTGETVNSYYDSINAKIENFKKINPNSKARDVLYEDIRKAQLEINQLIQDMKDYVKEYKDNIKQDYRDDVTSYKREKTLGDLLSDVQSLDRLSRVEDTSSSVFENYYKQFNLTNKRDVFADEYKKISDKLKNGGYTTDLEFTKDIDKLKSILEELKTVSKAWNEYENRELKAEEDFQKNLAKLVETSEKRVASEQKEYAKDSYKSEVTSYNREKILTGLLEDVKSLDKISKIGDTGGTNFYNYYKSRNEDDKRVEFDDEYKKISKKLKDGGYTTDLEFTKDIDGLKAMLEELKVVAKIWSERENEELKAEEQFNKNIDNLLKTAETRVDKEQKEQITLQGQKLIEGVKSEQNLFAYQKKEDESLKSSQDKLYKYIDDQIISLNRWYFSDETNQMFGSAGYSNIMDVYQNLSSRIGSDEFRTDRTAIEHAINDLKVAIDEFKKSVTSDKTIATNSIENQINWEREQNNINSNLEHIRNTAVTRLRADMEDFVRNLGNFVSLRNGTLTERGDVVYGVGGITARNGGLNGQSAVDSLNNIITGVGNIDLSQGAQHLTDEIQRLTIAFRALIDQTNQHINNEIKRENFETEQQNRTRNENERNARNNQRDINTALRQDNTDFSRIDKLGSMLVDFHDYLGKNTVIRGQIVNYAQIADQLGLDRINIQEMLQYVQTGVAGGRFAGLAGSVDYNEYVGYIKLAIDDFKAAITEVIRNEEIDRHDEQQQIKANKTLRDIDSLYNTFENSLVNDTGVVRNGNRQTRAEIYNWINPMGTGYISGLRQDLIDRFNRGEFDNNPIGLADAIQEFKDQVALANRQINNAISGIREENRRREEQARDIATRNRIEQELNRENLRNQINTDSLDTEMRKLIEFYGGHFNIGNQQYQNMQVIGNIQGYTDIAQAYQTLRDRIQGGEFNDNPQAFTQAINEFKETVRQFRQGSETLIRDFQNNIRQQDERARNLMRTGNTMANNLDANVLRIQRNPTLNTLFGDYGDPFMRGNIRIRLTEGEQRAFDAYRQHTRGLQAQFVRRDGETSEQYNNRAELATRMLEREQQNYNALREEIANRTGRHTGRIYNEFQEVYNPAMQSFMQRTGLNIFKIPNERGVDWEALSRGFTSGNRGAFTLELSKFINFPSLRQGIMNYLRDLQSIVTSWFHMMEHAFGRISKIVLTAAGAITGLTAGISATIVAFGAFGKSVVSTTDEFRRNTLALTGVYRTPEKAHEMLQMAYATSANMPMDYSAAMTTLNEISAIPSVQRLLRNPDRKISSSMMEKMFKVITAMTTMRPDKTASDAVFSLRNAFAGDLRSLQRRFDLPVNSIANVKNSIGLGKVKNDPMAMLESLNNYFDSFLDMDVMTQVSRTIGVITEKIKGAFDLFKANIGNSGIYDLVLNDVDKIKTIFVNFVDSDYGKQIARRISDALANSYEAIKGIARKIGKSILGAFGFDNKNLDIANVVTKLAEGFAKALRYVENVINSIDIEGYLKKAIDYISNIDLSNVIDRISMIATQVGHVARETYDAIVDTVTTLNNARRRLGITDETLARGLIAVWLFGGGNMIQFVSSQLHIIVSAVQIALGTIGSYISMQTAIFTAQGTQVATAIGTAFRNLFSTLGTMFLWLAVPAAEIYLIGNNIEVIGEHVANLFDTIRIGLKPLQTFITGIIASDIDGIKLIGDTIQSIFDINHIKDFFMSIINIAVEVSRLIAAKISKVFPKLGSWLLEVDDADTLEYSAKEGLKYQWNNANFIPKRVKDSFNSMWDNFKINMEVSLDDMKNIWGNFLTGKPIDELVQAMEENRQKYNPEMKGFQLSYGGSFFGIETPTLNRWLGIGDNNENEPERTQQNQNVITVTNTLTGIYSWLKQKAEPILNVIEPLYKMYKPQSVATNYAKAINKETVALGVSIRSQKSQYAKGFGIDSNSIFGDSTESSDSIYFGPVRLQAMLTELNNSIKTVEDYTKEYEKTVKSNASEQQIADVKKALDDNRNVVYKYRNSIVNMLNKSTEIIEDSIAQMDFSYVSKNINKYINAQSRTFDKKITSEVFKSIIQDYSSYFASNGRIGELLTEQINERHGNIRNFISDYNSGKAMIGTTTKQEDKIIRDFVERLGYYINTLTPIINEQTRIKGTQANIGNMRLGELNSNWGRYINDRSKAVRTTAGERYISLMNEGIENDTMGSMVRKVRDVAINSFTDMKTAVINAVQETVKSTQQTIKNGLDKMIMSGGSFKNSFKEIGDTIKKNYWGIYTNEIANNVTKFLYGYSENEKTQDPVVTLNTNVVDFKDDVIQKMNILIDSVNNGGLVKGSVQHQEKMGSMLSAFESSGDTESTIIGITAEEFARNAKAVAENTNTVNECAKGYRMTLDTFAGGVAYAGKKLFDFDSSVVDANDYFRALANNKNFKTIAIDETKSLLSQLKVGDTLSWWNGKHGDEMKQHVGVYVGNGQLASDHIEDMKNRNWFKWRLDDGYGMPQVSRLATISRTGHNGIENTPISSLDNNVADIRNDIKRIANGGAQTVNSEINAPTINNVINNVSGSDGGFNLNSLFGGLFGGSSTTGGLNISSGIADLGKRAGFGVIGSAIGKASGLSSLKSLFGSKSLNLSSIPLLSASSKGNKLTSLKLTGTGANAINSAIGMAGGLGVDISGVINEAIKPQTPLDGIWGTLFGTVENVESKFGGAAVGSLLGNMMAGKGIVDSLGAVALKTFSEGTEGAKLLAGANPLTKTVTGLTSTLLGKSAGQSVAKFLGKNFLGTTIGGALPIIGTVAKVLSGKGWFGGAKDRTAEGRARGDEFNSLRNSLIANRDTLARNYYMANSDTLDALKNYQFGEVAMWTSRRGHKLKGTKRTIMNTDATAFTNSMQGYWDLLQRATEEANNNQRNLDKLANTNNLEALRQTGSKESTRLASIAEDLAKYEAAVSRYAGHDTGFTQTLFDGQSYTMTQLNDKVQDLIKELGDSKNAIAQNTEAIRQEKLATADAKLDYETALYGKYNPLISQQNEIQKLKNEWNSVMNDDGTIGYKEGTKEWFNWSTRMLQATDNLEEATKQLEESAKQFKYDVANNWVNTLTQIRRSDGTYSANQVKKIADAYRKKVAVDSVGNSLESIMAGFNPTEMSDTEDVFKTETVYGKQNVTKWDMLSPNVKRVLSDLKRTGRASGNGLRGQEIQEIDSLLKSSNGNLSGLIDNLQNEVVGTRSVAIGTKQVKIGERTYTGTSPIKEGAITELYNTLKNYNKSVKNEADKIDISKYIDTKKATTTTLYDLSTGKFNEANFNNDIQKSLKTTEGKNALINLGITSDDSFKALTDKYNEAVNSNPTKWVQISKYWSERVTDEATKKKNINAANTEYLNAIQAAGYSKKSGVLTQKDGMYLFNAGGDTGNYQLFKFTKDQANQFTQIMFGKTIESYMDYAKKTVTVDNMSLKDGIKLSDLFKLVDAGVIKYSELLGKDLEHQIAMANFENVVDDIKQNITNVMSHTTTSAMDTIKANLESIKIVNKNSKDFLDTGDYTGYDDFMDKVILPLVQNIGGEIQNVAGIYEQAITSGFIKKSDATGAMTHMTEFMDKLEQAQYAYINALESGNSQDAKEAEKTLNELLSANSTYFKNLKNDYSNITKLVYQGNTRTSILGMISGDKDYSVANKALKAFNSKLGKNEMKNLIGLSGNFSNENIANMTGNDNIKSAVDNYEMFFYDQEARLLNRIASAQKNSEEYFAAEEEYYKLLYDYENYKIEKADALKNSIGGLLGNIAGDDNYDIANAAASEFNNLLGEDALKDFIGINSFSNNTIAAMTGDKSIKNAKDNYEMNFNYQRDELIKTINSSAYKSKEWVEANDQLMTLLLDNARYLAEKAERMPDTIDRVLGSMSGYDDYTVANSALTEFNKALGKDALNKLVGGQNGLKEFTDENIAQWFGVSGEDPYETYYEYQKNSIMDRIKKEKEGSEEWYEAELDLWNLMMENAKYLKDKAEKTTETIEQMLGRIEETAKMRVAEEAKSQKGDIIFFDLGASRDGTKLINNMLKAIKSNDPVAQKLVEEFKKKHIG